MTAGADATLNFDITGRDKGGADAFDRVGDAADGTSRKFDSTSVAAQKMSSEFAKAKIRAAELRKEFERTGDFAIAKELNKVNRDIDRFQRWEDHFEGGAKSAGLFGRAVSALKGSPLGALADTKVAVIGLGAATIGVQTAAGAALAGLGLGFVALGALAVRNNKLVKASAADLAADAQAMLARSGESMTLPIVRSLNILRGTVREIEPDLTGMFEDVSPHVEGLARGVDRLARNTMPGLKRAVGESGDVLDIVSAKLPETGEALSDFFDSLADSSEGGGRALAATLGLINGQIGILGETIEAGSKSFDFFTDADSWGASFSGVSSYLVDRLADTSSATRDAGMSAEAAGRQYSIAAADARIMGEELEEANRKIGASTLNAASATTAGQEALGRVRESLIENGRVFSDFNVKGRENNRLLQEGAQRSQAIYESVKARAIEQGRETTAVAEATAAQTAYNAQFRTLLTDMKVAPATIDQIFRTLGLIPPVDLKVDVKGEAEAMRKIEFAARARVAPVHAAASANAAEARLNNAARHRGTVISATASANAAEARLNATARNRPSTINASASANAAEARLNYAARDRYATVHLRTVGSANALERANGGVVRRPAGLADGGRSGYVRGPGTTTSDSIPAPWISDKEYVTRASSVSSIGLAAMDYMNRTGRLPVGLAGGGTLSAQQINDMPDSERFPYARKYGVPPAPAGYTWAEDYSLVRSSFFSGRPPTAAATAVTLPSQRAAVSRAVDAGPATVNLNITLQAGVIGSQREAYNWLTRAVDDLAKSGRLRALATSTRSN